MRCYLIRHGEIESNVKKVYAGKSQELLTTHGEKQVKLLTPHLKGKGIFILYTSPLRRAVQTAEILSKSLNVPVVQEDDLREIVLGPFDGLSHEEVMEQFPEIWRMWNQAPGELRMEGMEPLEEVQGRILSLFKKWCLKHENETIGAVTHMAVLRCTLLYQQGRSLNDYRKIEVPNAAIFAFDITVRKPNDGLELKLIEEFRGIEPL